MNANSKTAHTPGPWTARPFRVRVPTTQGTMDGPLMSYLAGDHGTGPGLTLSVASEREADHHLCAAAPDLLAALEDAALVINAMATGKLPPCFKPTLEMVNAINHALHKARPERVATDSAP